MVRQTYAFKQIINEYVEENSNTNGEESNRCLFIGHVHDIYTYPFFSNFLLKTINLIYHVLTEIIFPILSGGDVYLLVRMVIVINMLLYSIAFNLAYLYHEIEEIRHLYLGATIDILSNTSNDIFTFGLDGFSRWTGRSAVVYGFKGLKLQNPSNHYLFIGLAKKVEIT